MCVCRELREVRRLIDEGRSGASKAERRQSDLERLRRQAEAALRLKAQVAAMPASSSRFLPRADGKLPTAYQGYGVRAPQAVHDLYRSDGCAMERGERKAAEVRALDDPKRPRSQT